MGVAKVTGDVILDSVIARINKDYGKTLVTDRPVVESIPPLPTGSLGLDTAIGIGGLPKDRIIEIYGPESSGKTSWMVFWAKMYQLLDPERWVLISDVEHSMTENLLMGFGLDMNRCLHMRPTNIAEALDPLLDLVKTGRVGYIGLDSIDALQTEGELNKGVTESNVGGTSKVLSRFFREFSKVVQDCQCTGVFINQIRDNPGVGMYGNPLTTPGGKALKFYASLRLQALQAKPSENTKNAFTSRLQIKKNKCAPPVARTIECDFIYAKGPDPVIDTLAAGKDLGVLAFSGKNLKLKEIEGINVICTNGTAGYIEAVRKDPNLLARIRAACMNARTITEAITDQEEPDLEESEDGDKSV